MSDDPFGTRVVRRLNRLTLSRPSVGLCLAALAGFTLGPRLGEQWWPSAGELEDLFGPLDRRRAGILQRRISATELRNRATTYLLRHGGPAPLAARIRVHGAEGFQRLEDEKVPVAVVFWHLGAVRAVETALHALGHPILSATYLVPRGPDPGYRWRVVDSAAAGAQFVVESLRELKRGTVPVLALDGHARGGRRVPFLGRDIPIPGGAGALAVRGGARLVPVTSRWVGLTSRVEVVLHEPLPAVAAGRSDADREFAAVRSAVRWFEEYLLAHPEDLRLWNTRAVVTNRVEGPKSPSDADFVALADAFDAADQR